MNTHSLSWLDRMLIKIALAKAVARGKSGDGLAKFLAKEFASVSPVADTSRSTRRGAP